MSDQKKVHNDNNANLRSAYDGFSGISTANKTNPIERGFSGVVSANSNNGSDNTKSDYNQSTKTK